MGLAVEAMTLSHFRSHKLARFVLDGRPVVLFGDNGAGKTNVLEAVSLLSPGRGMRRAAAEEMARRPEAAGWKLRAEIRHLGQVHEIAVSWQGGSGRAVMIDGKAASQTALAGLVRLVWLVPAMDRLWIEGAEGRRRFLDRLALSFAPGHGDAALAYDKAMRERNRLLKDQISDPAWYGALEGRMAEAGAAIVANRAAAVSRLQAAQDGAETAFPAARLSIGGESAEIQCAEDLCAAWARGRRADMAAGRTLVGPHRADLDAVYAAKDLPARACSTGEQKALLLSLILANARALTEDLGAPPLLLLDEVAAHLDAGRRAALYDEVCALGVQAWMTGTGPELFEALGSRAQRFEVRDAEGASRVVEMHG